MSETQDIYATDYAYHFCKLWQAKYVVIVQRELTPDFRNADDTYCFKELKWAKQCYDKHQKGTGYPTILHSRLIKVENVKEEV